MTIPLASAQSLIATNFNTAATVASDAALANQYSGLLSQITTAAGQGLYTITYETLGGNIPQLKSMLERYGFTISVNNVFMTVTWANPTPIASPTVVLTSTQVTSALGFTPIPLSSLSAITTAAGANASLTYSSGAFTLTPGYPTFPTFATDAVANAVFGTPAEGMAYVDSTLHKLKVYLNNAWVAQT
jgi:hypothetical protein